MVDEETNSVKEQKNGTELKTNDPSECDPCIETKRGEKRVLDDTERYLRDKTGLSRRGIYIAGALLLVLLLLFVTVIALAASWPRTPHHLQFPVCKDSACLRASAQVSLTIIF